MKLVEELNSIVEINDKICPACTSTLKEGSINDFYLCPVCGQFQLDAEGQKSINRNHLASYLVYHRIKGAKESIGEYRFYTTRKKTPSSVSLRVGYMEPIYIDDDIITAWYPKRFSERIDNILLYIANHTKHVGQPLRLSVNQLLNVLFVDKQQADESLPIKKWSVRPECEYIQEANYMIQYLKQQSYIGAADFTELKSLDVVLTPKGYTRVEELQKNTSYGRNVLVAMKFGDDTKLLRESIRKGIFDAGYIAIFIDEVQHNDFITPELLKHIKDSKFVVVDLTHQNNGAYFEEGFAMGLGKPVIQLCKRGVKLHFDVAQKNTIIWESEDDISEKLCKRIKATID